MKITRLLLLGTLIILVFSSLLSMSSNGEDKEIKRKTRILFIFDASQSMVSRWQSGNKFKVAVKLFNRILDSLQNNKDLEVALRVYGAQSIYPPKDCNDTQLKVPFSKEDNIPKIKKTLAYIRPRGTSPIAKSLLESIADFSACENCRDLIVLITDGVEECDGDLCEVGRKLDSAGLSLKPFIIGIGRNFREEFDCIGTYFDASLEYQFSQALDLIVSLAMNSTSFHVELLDQKGQPTVSNVNLSLIKEAKVDRNFIHSIPKDGSMDTLSIDPIPTYQLQLHTIPSIFIDSIKFGAGKHNVIKIPASQGYLWFRTTGNLNTKNQMECIVRQHGKHETISVQNLGSKERYLTGCYDVEVLTRPRINLENICLQENLTTMVEVPASGIAAFQKGSAGFGSVYHEPSEGELNWVYNLNPESYRSEFVYLLPGNYRVVYRTKKADKSVFTIEKKFKVNTGKTTNIKLYK